MSSRHSILDALEEFQNTQSLSIKKFASCGDDILQSFIANATLAGAEVFTDTQQIQAQASKIIDSSDYFLYRSSLGVAENGALWCEDLGNDREKLFVSTHLMIQINEKNIVHTMADAYEKISLKNIDFGTFIAGPSKTADIEQSLVLGAHGAMSLSIFIEK